MLRSQNQHLRHAVNACRPELYRAGQRIGLLEEQNAKLLKENQRLTQKLADLAAKFQTQARPAAPAFVKANVPEKAQRKPGRKKGHPAALRPMPGKIDLHTTVSVPIDTLGKPCCPECRSQLSEVAEHQRYVEELRCPRRCSRPAITPPAAGVPRAAGRWSRGRRISRRRRICPTRNWASTRLATAAVLRVCYRLPLRQITRLFGALPGLKISPGAIVKQIRRLGGWLGKQYHRLKLVLRAAGVVYADETGWRTDGHNGQLWTLTNDRHTLYHVDRSRGGAVIAALLGAAFGQGGEGGGGGGQTLVSDFYSVYDQFDAAQQKCLAHLLRELRDTIAKRPEAWRGTRFSGSANAWCRTCCG